MAITEFEKIGSLFDDATVQLIGGLSPSNTTAVLNDLTQVQSGLTSFLTAHAEFHHNATGLHLQEVIDQINIEKAYINHQATTGDWTPKGINDVQRDILDIINGDAVLNELGGFTPLPSLLHDPRPFQLNSTQTALIEKSAAQFVFAGNDGNCGGERSRTSRRQGFNPSAPGFRHFSRHVFTRPGRPFFGPI